MSLFIDKESTMMTVALLLLLPYSIYSSGEGNIHLMDEEIAAALRSCQDHRDVKRVRRENRHFDSSSRIDGTIQRNRYNYQGGNRADEMSILNGTNLDSNVGGYEHYDDNFTNHLPRTVHGNENNSSRRYRRSDSLLSKEESDQCLSQCVFANLQVVDIHGIPREAELWNKVRTSVTSQQSRALLGDQIRACFHELQSESEDNGCSYSNKLERCLMLRLSDRNTKKSKTKSA